MTMSIAGLPAFRRAWTSALAISDAVVSVNSNMGLRSSGSAPRTSVARQHLVGRRRSPGTRGVLVGFTVCGPEVDYRVEDLPCVLDLFVPGEQRRITEQDVEDEPLVRLRARLDERATVREVHVDVADLHGRPRDLRPEPQSDALIGLDSHDEGVLPELLDRGGLERQMWCSLEHHGHLRDAAAESFPGAKVERHVRPTARLDIETDCGVRLRCRRR